MSDFHGLAGKICVVTGAASGIGRGIAQAFAREGARVVILDRAETEAPAGGVALVCDVADPASVALAAEAVAAMGGCDVLVNNAGMISVGPLATLPLAQWNALLAVNLTGYFLCAQAFGAQMRAKRKGALVHVASIAASHVTPNSGAYSVAKAGVTMLSHQLAVEWGADGIRSNAVHPGMILTPLSQSMYDRPGVTEARSAAVPAGRIGRPEDVAEAVLFLAGERSAYITGDCVTVDGGFTRMLLNLIPRAGYDRA
jgi:NAD(P)-dependent dehydrogenase (short-subunit alcohol dehydrogenase family)